MTWMPTLQDEHKKLSALVGSWTGEEHIHPTPWDAAGGSAMGRIESRSELDSFFVVSDYVQERGGKIAYRGHGVYSWDPQQKTYTMHWFDTAGGGTAMIALGSWKDDTLTFSHSGPMGHSRYVYTFERPNRYLFKIELSQDGKAWAPFIEGAYGRK